MYCDGIAMLRDRILAIRETQVYEPRSWRHFSPACASSAWKASWSARAPTSS
jgi:hypothetical protein